MSDGPVTLERLEIPPSGVDTPIGHIYPFQSRTGRMAVVQAHDQRFLSRNEALHVAAVLVAATESPGGES